MIHIRLYICLLVFSIYMGKLICWKFIYLKLNRTVLSKKYLPSVSSLLSRRNNWRYWKHLWCFFPTFFLQQNPNTGLNKARHKIKLSESLANTDTYPQKQRSSLDSPAVSQGQHTPETSQCALKTLFKVKWVMNPIQKSYHSPKEKSLDIRV